MSHLADTLKVIADYEWKLKYKHKKTNQINIDRISNSERNGYIDGTALRFLKAPRLGVCAA